MKRIMTAIIGLAFIASTSTVFAQDAPRQKRVSAPTANTERIDTMRQEIKTLRAQDRVAKAVDKFCADPAASQFRICNSNGPFELVSNPATKR